MAQQPPPPGYNQQNPGFEGAYVNDGGQMAGYAQPGQPPYGGYGQPPPQGYGQGQPPPPPGMYPQPGYPGQPPAAGYGQPYTIAGQIGPPQGYAGQPPPPQGMQPQQPPQQQWMPKPEGGGDCPPGLEYLTQIDQILIHQVVELLEIFVNWETCNRYQLKNSLGQQIYFAGEESDTCQRQCCGPSRGFQMHISDNMGNEVIRVSRDFKCCAGCQWCAGSDCCAMVVQVEAPVGQVVGYVKQRMSCLAPKFAIMDAQEQVILTIEGPVCICQGPCCTQDQEFKVMSADGTQDVGMISKQWSGFVKEYFTQADNFGVKFPMDLDVRMKAVMIGAVFLIDFMYFENKNNNRNNGGYGAY